MVTRRILLSLVFILVAVSSRAVIAVPKDRDCDGMPDAWEQMYGLNINDPADALSDPDLDGFPNLTEYLLDTDPLDGESRPALADNRDVIIAYWPLATNAVEALSTNLTGTLRNGAVFNNSAVKLDGKDDYVNFGNASALSVTGSISFCLWLKPEQSCGTTRILGKFKTAGNSREYAVFAGPDDRLWIFFSDNGSADIGHSILKVTDRRILHDKKWQHLAVTWDVTGGSDGVSCYMDGRRMPLYDMVLSDITFLHAGQADLTLGAYDMFTVGWGRWQREMVQNSFKGFMSQLILCRGVLSGDEIREIELLGRLGDIKDWVDMDFDQDGMPDWWERKYFGDISQGADSDFDNDGLNNIREYQAGADPASSDTDGDGFTDGAEIDGGTNPCDSASKPQVKFVVIRGRISFAEDVLAGEVRVIVTFDRLSWSSRFCEHLAGPDSYVIEGVPVGSNCWLKAWCDYNGNGSNESWEACGEYHVNPFVVTGDVSSADILIANPDRDEDGLPDWWENKYGIESNPSDALVDTDGDGLNNISEYRNHTDPLNVDSDGDDLRDGLEVDKYHTDPLVVDTDGDGLSDGEEAKEKRVVVCWGNNDDGELNVPSDVGQVIAVAAGYNRSMALRVDGTVASWGYMEDGPVPDGLTGVVAIAAGESHSLALKNDGTVAGWGWNWYGQACVPDGLTGVVAVAAGWNHSLALKGNGTVVCWGCNELDQISVPNGLTGVVAIAAGGDFSMALRNDGTIICWGYNGNGQEDVPGGLTGVVAMAVGGWHTMALKGDGKVVCWGMSWDGRTNVPEGLTGVMAIAAGSDHSMALRNDGTVVCWGYNGDGQVDVPGGLTGVVAIAAGEYHSMAVKSVSSLNPLSPDTDGDTLPDGWEMRNGVDPMVNDADLDKDGDGLSNSEEFRNSTYPNKVDSDDDGMNDASELLLGFNPLISNGYVNVPFFENFNLAPEGDINGWNGWISSSPGSAVIEATNVHSGQFAVELKPSSAVARVLHPVAAMGVGYIQESYFTRPVRLQADEQPVMPDRATVVGWYIDAEGLLVVRDGVMWRTLSDLPAIAGNDWIKLVTRQDYINQKWAIWINGFKYAGDLAFVNPLKEYAGFVVYGSRRESVFIDGVSVTQYSINDPVTLQDVKDLRVDEMGLGWARMVWSSSVSPGVVGYKMRVSRKETKDAEPIEVGALIDLGNVTSVTLTNLPGYYYSVEIHVYDSLGDMTHTAIRTFGQNIGLILSAKCIWPNTGGIYLPVAVEPSIENPYTFVAGSCNVASNYTDHLFISSDVDAVGGVGVDDELWMRANEGEWVKLMGFGGSGMIDVSQYLTREDNYLEFKAVDTEGSPLNGQPATCCSATDLYVVQVAMPRLALTPDFNHDRAIDDANDYGQATMDNPFRFWINDDGDYSATEGDDMPGAPGNIGGPNCDNGFIDSVRDLVDFFPVFVDVKEVMPLLQPDKYEYLLKNADAALNCIFTDLKISEVGKYLTDKAVAESIGNNSVVSPISSSGLKIKAEFLDKILKDGKGVILVEAKMPTVLPLVLSIVDKADGKVVIEKELRLSISGVENMYRWINLRTSGGMPTSTAEPGNNPDFSSNGKQMLFIHGFNVDEYNARGCISEVFKRLYWSGSKSMFTGVTWHGDETPGILPAAAYYHADVINALQVAENFKNAVSALPGQLYVMAHSLGNMVVSSAIKDYGLNPVNYFMIDAAVAMQAYNGAIENVSEMVPLPWLDYTNRLWASDWYKLFLSGPTDNRKKLSWRARFGNIAQAYNYYSSGEEVLSNNDPVETLNLPHTEKAWVFQEQIKGGVLPAILIGVESHGGWGFNHFWDVGGIASARPADQAALLTESQLRANSFFKPLYRNDIYGDSGSAVAADIQVRIKILAEAIPATSRAAGRNAIPTFGVDNIDMMTFAVNGWPEERQSNPKMKDRWLHSDFKDVAYLYIYKLYDDISYNGGLR